MKKIHIFLASSITEFESERYLLENFIRRIGDDFLDRYGIRVVPLLCENLDSAIASVRKQEEYNQLIRQSDMCFFLFFTKAGEYTQEEFRVALDAFRQNGKPHIYTYFKRLPEGQSPTEGLIAFMERLDRELGHYYSMFDHIDTVKLRILESLQAQEMTYVELKAENGKCTVDGKEVLSLANVSEFANNRMLTELQAELTLVEEEYFRLKPIYAAGGCDSDFYRKYSALASRRESLKDEIEAIEKQVFDISLRMCRDTLHGDITLRQKEAYRLFEQGDYDGCMRVLDAAEIDSDFLAARKRLKEKDIALCRRYIREHVTAIEILEALTEYRERFDEILSRYEKIVPVALEEGVELGTVYEYCKFLYKQMRRADSLSLALRLEKVCLGVSDAQYLLIKVYHHLVDVYYDENMPKAVEAYIEKAIACTESLALAEPLIYRTLLADGYGMAGFFYMEQGQSEKADAYFQKSLAIREVLAEKADDDELAALATTYCDIADFRSEEWETATVYYEKALRIMEELVQRNPDKFLENAALCYQRVGIFYEKQGNCEKAEDYYERSLKIEESLALINPERYLPHVPSRYLALGSLYGNQGKHEKAEKFFQHAIDMCEAFCESDPVLFRRLLARCYNNAALFYHDQGRLEQAERLDLKAIAIYEELVQQNPEHHRPDLATTYNNLALLYTEQGDYAEAEIYHQKALATYEELAKADTRHLGTLATLYSNISICYQDQMRFEEAEAYLHKAILIKERLAEENPDRYLSSLAIAYNNLGRLYSEKGMYDEAIEIFMRSVGICEKLAEENPGGYLGSLAKEYSNLSVAFFGKGDVEKGKEYRWRAIGIYQKLTEKNPERYRDDLADEYLDTAERCSERNEPEEADKFYSLALALYEKLAEEDPDRYLEKLASVYGEVSVFYSHYNAMDEAEVYLLKEMKTLQNLADRDPEAYFDGLAGCYDYAGRFYAEMDKPKEAEECYSLALAILEEFAEKDPEQYLLKLATCYWDVGSLYATYEYFEESHLFFQKCIAIMEGPAQKDPECKAVLAERYWQIGKYYQDWELEKAEACMLQAISLYESLAKTDPMQYLPDLAFCYYLYGHFKEEQSYIDKACRIAKRFPNNETCQAILEDVEDEE